MNGEFHQLASAILVLAFSAVMLVIGLLFDLPAPADGVLSLANEVGALRAHK